MVHENAKNHSQALPDGHIQVSLNVLMLAWAGENPPV